METNPKRVLLCQSYPQTFLPANSLGSPLDIPLAATNWQASATCRQYRQISAQVLAVAVPTRPPQRALAHAMRPAVFARARSLQVRISNRRRYQKSRRQALINAQAQGRQPHLSQTLFSLLFLLPNTIGKWLTSLNDETILSARVPPSIKSGWHLSFRTVRVIIQGKHLPA
jgi:hypothetical protein